MGGTFLLSNAPAFSEFVLSWFRIERDFVTDQIDR
jgi:hypothetical protein